MSDPYFESGKWWIGKDPDDECFYTADVSQQLADANTSAIAVEVILAGVQKLEEPEVQGPLMVVKLGGLDTSTGAENYCTFRVTCANTERFDKTIWFKREDH